MNNAAALAAAVLAGGPPLIQDPGFLFHRFESHRFRFTSGLSIVGRVIGRQSRKYSPNDRRSALGAAA